MPAIHLRDDGFLPPEERAGLKRLAARGAGRDTDPQVGILSRLSGIARPVVQTGLIVLLALLVV